MRLELEGNPVLSLEAIELTQPVMSLMFGNAPDDPAAQSILVQVDLVEILSTVPNHPELPQRVAMEMRFPDTLERQQRNKIKKLLRSLS
jgi:hypothetical protein